MLIKLFSQSFLGSVVYAITQWLIISSITRILSLESTGEYATALGIAVTVNIFFNFGIRQITYSSKAESTKYLALPVIFLQLIGLFVCILITYFNYHNLIKLTILIYLFKIIETLTEYKYGLYQQADNHKKIAQSRILRSISYTCSFIFILQITHNINYAVFSMFIINTCLFFIIDKIKITDFKFIGIDKIKHTFIISGFPLAITAALLSLRTTSPRYIIEYYMGYSSVGLFVSYLYLINAGGMVIQSWAQVIAPQVSRLMNKRLFSELKKKYFSGLSIAILYSSLAALVFCIFSKEIIHMIYGEKVEITRHITIALSLLMVITYLSSFNGYMLTAVREFHVQPKIFAGLFIFSIILVTIAAYMNSIIYILYVLILTSLLQLIIVEICFHLKLRI